jgi:signal transduction histidine kinase/ligand-binding sensor domain-containing protein/AraC-like DNA-binding protein
MFKRSRKLLFFSFCSFLSLSSYTQSGEYVFSHLDFTNGLSSNHITCLYKDTKGFMWIGTTSGLNRYDGYQFNIYKHDFRDSSSIDDNYIEQIFEGPDSKLWIGTRSGGFEIYDFATDHFSHNYASYLKNLSLPQYWLLSVVKGNSGFWFVYKDGGLFHYLPNGRMINLTHVENDNSSLAASGIVSSRLDPDGDLWIIHQNGILEKIDGLQNKVVFRTDILQKNIGRDLILCSMYLDDQNDLWFCSNGDFKGAYFYRPGTNLIRHLYQGSKEGNLSSNIVYNTLQDEKGLIWLATDHGGVNIVDKKDFSLRFVEHVENDNRSLAENSVPAMYKDDLGIIWLGTFKSGIDYFHQNLTKFPHYRHQPLNPSSLSYDDVNNFVEDPAGNIWIGSNGGGLIYFNRKENTFRQYLHHADNPNSLSNNIIVSLLLDKNNKLWIGTYFGGLDCYDGKKFTHFKHNDEIPTSLADDRIMCLYQDSDDNLWMGTLEKGMERYDPKKNIFYHYNSGQSNSLRNNYVSSITEDAHKNLWIATAFGIDVLEKNTGKFVHYSNTDNQLSSNNVILLLKDSHGNMWAGTREGLSLFNPEKKTFQSFRTEDGLPDNTIRCLLEDNSHDLWISTSNGISRIHADPLHDHSGYRIQCKKYHEQDGLQGREFNERAGLKTKEGDLLFGGPNGFNIFNPTEIVYKNTAPPLIFTDLEIFNKSVHAGDKTGKHIILNESIMETDQIVLRHSDDIFSLEFASLGFIYNAKTKYAYILEGFNKNWLEADSKVRKAIYTNLDPGQYTLRVKATNEDGEWGEKEISVKIIILPPFWKTPLAYFLYLALFIAILYFARKMIIQRARMRFALEHERQEAKRMHEMDMMKIRFFTNMSHELRTPLSLILAPVEKLLKGPPLPDPRKQYELIRRNATRLFYLVNQLLDFKKMEVNELELQGTEGDILKFIKDISFSFIDLAERKNISFSYRSSDKSLITQFDQDKIERVLFNLLSNAFKFTPEDGSVGVEVGVDRSKNDEVILQIQVKDTGIGIAKENLKKIFERFFQTKVPNTILNQGSGIGLAISMEFVKMHKGNIWVESEPGKGSCFTVTLPFKEVDGTGFDPLPPAEPEEVHEHVFSAAEAGPLRASRPALSVNGAKKSTILVVEDNEDFRFYLKDNLQSFYTIIEAADGKEGWQKSLALHPDLVVSDISMPIMSGTDLCRKIKEDERTKQIPVILLTALAHEGDELKSLKTGATDYITKPFDFEVLLSKVMNVLKYNETIRQTYQRQVNASPAAIEIESADDAFMKNVLELIEKNIGNPDFTVGELSTTFHASRSTIYNRFLLLTGKTPIEFIRHIRLKRAAELLEKSQLSVSEIAYKVGFNNPKYFSQYFKMEFSMIPSAYRAQKRGK